MSDVEPTATEVILDVDSAPRPRARSVALLVGIVAVLGGAIFAGLSLADDSNAPEDPVRAMLEAVERGDILGVLEQLEPGERDAVREPLTDLVDELNRLDVLEGADLGDLRGIDVTIEDLELESERVGSDVAAVTITGGRGSFRYAAGELPLGSFVRDLFGDSIDDAQGSGEDSLASDDRDDFVATVKRDGRWYVSVGYTMAEDARRDAGISFADLGEGVAPKGADSPEDAIRQMIEAAQGFDVRRLIELLPPGEMGAVQDYAGLFLDEAMDAAAEAEGELDLVVGSLELESETSGDRATVFVREFEFEASAGGEGRVQYADGCLTIEVRGEQRQKVCAGDDPAALLEGTLGGSMFGAGMFESLFEGVEPPQLSFEGEQPAYGISTVRVDGEWFVSPTRTVLGGLVETLRLFEPRDLVEIRRFVEDVFASFETNLQRSATTAAVPDE